MNESGERELERSEPQFFNKDALTIYSDSRKNAPLRY